MKIFCSLLLLIFLGFSAIAQTHTVSGYVADAESGERLIGASVHLPWCKTFPLWGYFAYLSSVKVKQ